MNFKNYIKDKIIYISIKAFVISMAFLTLNAFKVRLSCSISILCVLVLTDIGIMIYDFYTRKSFYDKFIENINELDKKYLVGETISEPEFTEAKILLSACYDINMCMQDELNILNKSMKEFKEYVEMWIHEIKLPIASLMLMNYNKTFDYEKEKQKLYLLEKYVEQILFYVRSDTADKDYLLKKVNLEELVNNIVKSHKDLLIGNKISIKKTNLDINVVTDSKWMEFIVGQIISNCIKYTKDKYPSGKSAYISFECQLEKEKVIFIIEDNGIGISKEDIKRVFDKSFTGQNGRIGQNSTGMGLYLCKKLCEKLGHLIKISSVADEYTRVSIEFGRNNYYLND